MGNSSNRDRSKAAVAEKRKRALQLRCDGFNIRQIAAHMQLSVGRVHALIDEAIKEIPSEERERLRRIECERLETLYKAGMQGVRKGNPQMIRALVAVVDRHCKLLGLDAPTVTELTGKDGGPVALSIEELEIAIRTGADNASETPSDADAERDSGSERSED